MKKLIVLGLCALSGMAQAATLYNNGTTLTSGNLSVLDNVNTLDTTLGATTSSVAGITLADNFTVTGAGWNVASLDFFAYQTSAVGFTFTTATWSIISGTSITGPVVASGTTAVTNGGLVGYRVAASAPTLTNRAIYTVSADVPDFTLGAGSYFVTWALAGTGASGPFAPPTIAATGNAMQNTGATWVSVTDGGSGRTLEMPFAINGTVAAVPEPATVALMLAGVVGVMGAARRRVSSARA